MALLSDSNRAELMADWMRDNRAAVSVTKADLRAAVNALDAFLDTNVTAINNAIPLPARTGLSTAQKAQLLMFVIRQRYVKGA